ncbi:MAG: hypothetical protein HHAS10_12070 [Candidatus Altimarinota bacterium]
MSHIIPIGTVQKSHILEDKALLSLNYNILKSGHGGIFGKSGSGKTYSLVSTLFSTIKSSILQQSQPDNTKYGDTFVCIDPHNSFINPLLNLLGEYLIDNPKLSRYGDIFRFSNETIENNKKYRGFYMDKTFFFNPLFALSLVEDITDLNKWVNYNISSLKGVFNYSAFGPSNTKVLEGLIRSFIVINIERYHRDPDNVLLSYRDLYDLLDYTSRCQKLPTYLDEDRKKLFSSTHSDILQLANGVDQELKTFLKDLQVDKQSHITSLTKLKDFSFGLGDTFGYGKSYKELTLDIEHYMSGEKKQTEVYLFDFSVFNTQERRVVISFLTNILYHIGAGKNHNNPNLGSHYYTCDEFQSFLELQGSKNHMLDILEKILNEHRKKKINMLFIFQSISRELQDLLNNLSYSLIFALPPEQAELFVPITNSGLEQKFAISEKDIVNLKRGEFYSVFDTINHGTLSILTQSLNIGDQNIQKLLKSNGEKYE